MIRSVVGAEKWMSSTEECEEEFISGLPGY